MSTTFDKFMVKDQYGSPQYRLNERLATAQGVTDEQLTKLRDLHQQKLMLFEQMELLDPTTEPGRLKSLAFAVEQIEFDLQANWNFPQDPNFHEWYLVPHCKCPTLDNRDRKGTQFKVISTFCPIHGK